MARPVKKNATYFSHDSDASSRQTITLLESKYGNDGYAFWFKLLEELCNSDGLHVYVDKNPVYVLFLSTKMHLSEQLFLEMVDLVARIGAIDFELWSNHRVIFSSNLLERLKYAFSRRSESLPSHNQIIAAYKNGVNVCNNSVTVTNCEQKLDSCSDNVNNNAIAARKGKGKEIKGNKPLSDFEEFWESVPTRARRCGKAEALKSWGKHVNGDARDVIASIKLFSASYDWTKDGGKYCPMISTWINQQRWTADPASLVVPDIHILPASGTSDSTNEINRLIAMGLPVGGAL